MLESAQNNGVADQNLGRGRRLGNPSHVVYVYEYHVGDTFNDKTV